MRENIFQIVPLVRPSFFQKIFKQLPIENSVIEVNNLLASYSIKDIPKEHINEIEEKYQINLEKEFKLNLEEFYAVYLNHYLKDGILKDSDFENLNHLSYILSLKKDSVEMLVLKIGEIVYRKFFTKAISNGRLIRREEEFLEKIENEMNLPKTLVNKISYEMKNNFLQDYVRNVINNKELSPDIEKEINNISESLRIDLVFTKDITKQIENLKLYWKIENLDLQTIEADILIQKSETCYFRANSVKWYEFKSLRQKPTNYISNFKVLKEFYLNLNSQGANNNNPYIKYVDSGSLYLTNKRIIFIGRNKNINIRFEKILRLTPQLDGIEVEKDTIKSAFIQLTNKADEFSLILNKLIIIK
ncbi:hypothetical protein [Flavobacterium hungaricum]|uniref:Uncharacterized protein n=1 Tax=Flavobacterium hungaricum TaxID=2082725 RepID=A0ABR9TLG8_9FLAO|nr:hypothetical protein [Flavobacterium hungaricum]MBE8726196.1 hypothetical protein [Flavobacterium hungaricum]